VLKDFSAEERATLRRLLDRVLSGLSAAPASRT